MFLLTHNSWNYKQMEKFKTQTLFYWTSHQFIAHLVLAYISSTERFQYLSRGEICVANFKAPCEWYEFGQVFNGQLGHLYKLGD